MSGKLTDRTKFTSSYPTSLQAPQFTRLLDQHDVQVTTQPAQTSIGSILLNLLPLAIILGLFLWTGRHPPPARQHGWTAARGWSRLSRQP